VLNAYAQLPKTYQTTTGWHSTLPRTNSISDILINCDSIWIGTERGLSLTVDNGINWNHFSGTGMFDDKGISAIALNDTVIWVAIGYSTKLENEDIQTGGGLHYSTDKGIIWHFIPQPVDHGIVNTLDYGIKNKIRTLAITVPQQNITFDIALTKNTVWIASWAGMLRKSTDYGINWKQVILPPDNLDYIDTTLTLNFDLSPVDKKFTLDGKQDSLVGNLNHSVFSIYASDDTTIWIGTAGGINKSTDGGISWRKFSHQNQSKPISGNFVVALKEQRLPNRRIIWAATVNAEDNNETKGISYSSDSGESWTTTLQGEFAHNIEFNDSIVYVATDGGLYRSSNFGDSWIRSGTIHDTSNLQRFVSAEIYALDLKGDTLWVGGPEGIAYTIDSPLQPFGSRWRIFRTAEQIRAENRTYAYPNPFSPDDEPVRIHYSLIGKSSYSEITIRIFDYAMQPVRTLVQKATRQSGQEYDEIWDGKNDRQSYVANGVYFYRVEVNDQSPIWGKILVLK
jgi:ligand-binding sensor domain-containing protein